MKLTCHHHLCQSTFSSCPEHRCDVWNCSSFNAMIKLPVNLPKTRQRQKKMLRSQIIQLCQKSKEYLFKFLWLCITCDRTDTLGCNRFRERTFQRKKLISLSYTLLVKQMKLTIDCVILKPPLLFNKTITDSLDFNQHFREEICGHDHNNVFPNMKTQLCVFSISMLSASKAQSLHSFSNQLSTCQLSLFFIFSTAM